MTQAIYSTKCTYCGQYTPLKKKSGPINILKRVPTHQEARIFVQELNKEHCIGKKYSTDFGKLTNPEARKE